MLVCQVFSWYIFHLYQFGSFAIISGITVMIWFPQYDDQGAITYVIHCAEEDHVFVEQGSAAGGSMTGYHSYFGGVMKAFSGFLIQMD